MRLARGSGLRGLGGMRPRHGLWLKPMLEATRGTSSTTSSALASAGARTRATLRANTCATPRHDVVPALRAAAAGTPRATLRPARGLRRRRGASGMAHRDGLRAAAARGREPRRPGRSGSTCAPSRPGAIRPCAGGAGWLVEARLPVLARAHPGGAGAARGPGRIAHGEGGAHARARPQGHDPGGWLALETPKRASGRTSRQGGGKAGPPNAIPWRGSSPHFPKVIPAAPFGRPITHSTATPTRRRRTAASRLERHERAATRRAGRPCTPSALLRRTDRRPRP